MSPSLPTLGVGLGYRPELQGLVDQPDLVDWVEVISEHFMGADDAAVAKLRDTVHEKPVIPHGIEMSIGTVGNDDEWLAYIADLSQLVARLNAPWFSDHLCFTKTSAHSEIAALAPLPCSFDAVQHVATRAKRAQEIVGRPLLLENIAYHFSWGREMSEAEFVARVLDAGDCFMLLDLTNLWYNANNHGFSAADYLNTIPLERVGQIHLAGGVLGRVSK
jgi:uncharacterized protein (UPF0276 family)